MCVLVAVAAASVGACSSSRPLRVVNTPLPTTSATPVVSPSLHPSVATASTSHRSSTPRSTQYQNYSNPRFGFSVDVPVNYRKQPPPEDGDGAAFTSPDGKAQLSVFGENNVLGDTSATGLAKEVQEVEGSGGQVTYRFVDDQSYICSGYDANGNVFYDRWVIYSHAEYGMRWGYSPSIKTAMDSVVQHSVVSYKPGPNARG